VAFVARPGKMVSSAQISVTLTEHAKSKDAIPEHRALEIQHFQSQGLDLGEKLNVRLL
jgi:hypothetical protein